MEAERLMARGPSSPSSSPSRATSSSSLQVGYLHHMEDEYPGGWRSIPADISILKMV